MDYSDELVKLGEELIKLAVQHFGIDVPVVKIGVNGELVTVTLLGGQVLSCKFSELDEVKPIKTKKAKS